MTDTLTCVIREEIGRLLGIKKPEEEMLAVLAPDAFLRLPGVTALTGLSAAGIYRGMTDGTFPKPVVLGPNARAWRLSEIKAWQTKIIAARDNGTDADLRAINPNIGRGRRPKRAA